VAPLGARPILGTRGDRRTGPGRLDGALARYRDDVAAQGGFVAGNPARDSLDWAIGPDGARLRIRPQDRRIGRRSNAQGSGSRS
jgi:hypothetical protein